MTDNAQPPRRPARWKPLLAAFVAAFAVASLGGAATDLGPWYQNLRKPDWQPPPLAFPIVWTLIFALFALSGVEAWMRAPTRAGQQAVIGFYALNGFLNVLWTILFFDLKRPDWALIEVGALWLSVLGLMVWQWPRARTAALLLTPYLVWVAVAAALNVEIVRLNGPFG